MRGTTQFAEMGDMSTTMWHIGGGVSIHGRVPIQRIPQKTNLLPTNTNVKQQTQRLSRECLNLSCLPNPYFADMSCRWHVGDMSLFMSPTRRHCMSDRVSKRHDIWQHVGDSQHFCNFVIVVSAQTQKLDGSYGSFWGVEWVTSLWPVATVEGAQTLYIYLMKTCYEYEPYGGLNHKH